MRCSKLWNWYKEYKHRSNNHYNNHYNKSTNHNYNRNYNPNRNCNHNRNQKCVRFNSIVSIKYIDNKLTERKKRLLWWSQYDYIEFIQYAILSQYASKHNNEKYLTF